LIEKILIKIPPLDREERKTRGLGEKKKESAHPGCSKREIAHKTANRQKNVNIWFTLWEIFDGGGAGFVRKRKEGLDRPIRTFYQSCGDITKRDHRKAKIL